MKVFLCTLLLAFTTTASAQSSDERFSEKLEKSSLPASEKRFVLEQREFEKKRSKIQSLIEQGIPEAHRDLGDLYATPSQFQNKTLALKHYKEARKLKVPGIAPRIDKLTHQNK